MVRLGASLVNQKGTGGQQTKFGQLPVVTEKLSCTGVAHTENITGGLFSTGCRGCLPLKSDPHHLRCLKIAKPIPPIPNDDDRKKRRGTQGASTGGAGAITRLVVSGFFGCGCPYFLLFFASCRVTWPCRRKKAVHQMSTAEIN